VFGPLVDLQVRDVFCLPSPTLQEGFEENKGASEEVGSHFGTFRLRQWVAPQCSMIAGEEEWPPGAL
jgi:hypothetical protein